jgi:hypothetical protein
MKNQKPAQTPSSSPKTSSTPNPNYPSKTGKDSGTGRGNTPKK